MSTKLPNQPIFTIRVFFTPNLPDQHTIHEGYLRAMINSDHFTATYGVGQKIHWFRKNIFWIKKKSSICGESPTFRHPYLFLDCDSREERELLSAFFPFSWFNLIAFYPSPYTTIVLNRNMLNIPILAFYPSLYNRYPILNNH